MGDSYSHNLRDALPELPWFTPDTEEFQKRRHTYCASNPAVPQAILCPRNADEVSAIVKSARANNIPFSVRTGGHDVFGRSMVQDALCIDMRDIDDVNIAEDRKTAVIGGGTRLGKLSTELHAHGLVTPHGSVPSIGYVGWASLGGYGASSRGMGLGVDQILEAEVVNDKGDIVNADEDMLKGIRGAGGNFGIITSLRIKVYEVNKLLGGFIIFDTSKGGISQVFKDVMLKVEDLEAQDAFPLELVIQPLVINSPQSGRTFGMTYIWTSNDHDKGREFMDKLTQNLPATVVMNTVSEVSAPEWLNMLDQAIAKSAWGGSQAVSFGRLSSKILDIMGQHLEKMPSDPGSCFSLHMLAKESPSVTNTALAEASCFNPEARQAHTLIEIVGSSATEEAMERCGQWAKHMRKDLLASGEAMNSTYVSLVGPETTSLQKIYGEKLDLLMALKQKYDPDGVFRHAVPRMLD